jgi:membrane-associated phospholipid phosphatase
MSSNSQTTAPSSTRRSVTLRLANGSHGLVGALNRRLPRGVTHLCVQFQIWVAFFFAYIFTRGVADHNVDAAFVNGQWIARTEDRMGLLFEPSLQRALGGDVFTKLMALTYWLSQFVVVVVAFFWIYLRAHKHFAFFRNWFFLANTAGLVCYVLVPTAPPRMLPQWGFTDTLATTGPVDHQSGLVELLSNQYAAMPSLHVMDAFIVGAMLCVASYRVWTRWMWLLWPGWVALAVLSTGNHYWLDIAAGLALAAVTAGALQAHRVLRPVQARGAPPLPASE